MLLFQLPEGVFQQHRLLTLRLGLVGAGMADHNQFLSRECVTARGQVQKKQ